MAVGLASLACIDGDLVDEALEAAQNVPAETALEYRMRLEMLLWRATGSVSHLERARYMLDHLLSAAPVEHRSRMAKNLRVNREILVAWREEFGEDAVATDDPEAVAGA